MPEDDRYITRYEFQQQLAAFDRLTRRVEEIDVGGTRGTGAITVQLSQLSRDLSEYRVTNASWQAAHEAEHTSEINRRASNRKWIIGTVIAGLATMSAVVIMLATLLFRIHP